MTWLGSIASLFHAIPWRPLTAYRIRKAKAELLAPLPPVIRTWQ
jgi:hypothetical protein